MDFHINQVRLKKYRIHIPFIATVGDPLDRIVCRVLDRLTANHQPGSQIPPCQQVTHPAGVKIFPVDSCPPAGKEIGGTAPTIGERERTIPSAGTKMFFDPCACDGHSLSLSQIYSVLHENGEGIIIGPDFGFIERATPAYAIPSSPLSAELSTATLDHWHYPT